MSLHGPTQQSIMFTRRTTLLLCLGIALGLFAWRQPPRPCRSPLLYRIGQVDARFGLNADAMREALEEAERLWEDAVGRELFAYAPTASLTVNLLFDERQQTTQAQQRLHPKLQQIEASHTSVAESYKTWHALYETKRTAYDAAKTAFDERLQTYNTRVQEWNRQGGAPRHIQASFDAERAQIEADKTQLMAAQVDLRDTVETLQSLATDGKALEETYTRQAQSYNALYGERRAFHKGEYNGREITIYQYHDLPDLILVLAHELGHALGLAHVADAQAVMAVFLSEQDLDALALTNADRQELTAVCQR